MMENQTDDWEREIAVVASKLQEKLGPELSFGECMALIRLLELNCLVWPDGFDTLGVAGSETGWVASVFSNNPHLEGDLLYLLYEQGEYAKYQDLIEPLRSRLLGDGDIIVK
jgi:hypothetical protein